jgi:hypothetical protein
MNYAQRLIIITLILLFSKSNTYENTTGTSKLLTFDDLKHFIAFYESSNGKFKFNQNKNGTVDCGLYQVNSSHFDISRDRDKEIARDFDSVFTTYKVSKFLSDRVVETIKNDSLCYDLASLLYSKRGIDQWTCYPKFKKYLEGYHYVRVSPLSSKSNGKRSYSHKRNTRTGI